MVSGGFKLRFSWEQFKWTGLQFPETKNAQYNVRPARTNSYLFLTVCSQAWDQRGVSVAEQAAAKQHRDPQRSRAGPATLSSSELIPNCQVGTPAEQSTASSSLVGRQQKGGGRKGRIRQIPACHTLKGINCNSWLIIWAQWLL